ncbi:hypothetical protein AVEN_89990-1 [Araneus ventricosus]|uniref:Uncharacterized protein n=1 Tax=Araneus ventricosus TaxID=182803 RepID=A0A4Y2DA95_ARAVE|nr:hypothetical protein AVEN_89990-1 [Araneus ventricosus]
MFGEFLPLACLLILLQNVCIDSFSVINIRSSGDEDSENDNSDQLVPEQSTEIVVIEEKQATDSEDDETIKNSNSYLPTIRYIEENNKPIIFIRESEEVDDPKPSDDELEMNENDDSSSPIDYDEPRKKNNKNKILSVRELDEPSIEYVADYGIEQFDFRTTKEPRHRVTDSTERDSEKVDYTEPADDELEESENDDSPSSNDHDEPRKNNNKNKNLSVRQPDESSEEYEAEYESDDLAVTTTEKSRSRFTSSSKRSTRPMKQKAKSNEFKEDFGDTDLGIKLKITAKRDKRISGFTYETKLPEKDKDLFAIEKKSQESSKDDGEFLKSHNIKKFGTDLKQTNSIPRERSLIKEVNNTKQIYDNSSGNNESYTLNYKTENEVPKLFDKFKKSFRNHAAEILPSNKESITFNNFYNDIKNLSKSRREMKSSVSDQQIQNSPQLFRRDKRESKRSTAQYSAFKRRSNTLGKDRNQEQLLDNLKKFRFKRENGDEDKTEELLDQLQNLLVKANIAQDLSSGFKSTVAPIDVFDFTPLSNSNSLMSESDLTTFFVHHIIPFLTKNSEPDELNQKPVKEHGMPAKREMKDENVLKIKMTNQEFDIRSRDGRSQGNKSLLSNIFLKPNVHSRSAARKLMTREKVNVKNRGDDFKPPTLTIPQKFPINLENSTVNVTKRNSEIEQDPHKKYLKNKHFNSDGFNPVPAVSFKTQFARNSKMNDFSSYTFKEKRDEKYPEKRPVFLPNNQTSYSGLADLKQTSNNNNFPLNNLPGNSNALTGDSNFDFFNNHSDINVLKVPESSNLASEPSASGFTKYQEAIDVSDNAGNLLTSTTESVYMPGNFAKENKFSDLDQNPPNLYITPSDLLYAENNPNLNIYMNNNSGNGNLPSGTENINSSPNDAWASEKLTYKKSISSSSKDNDGKARNDAIVISIRIPESILKRLANEAVFGQKNDQPRQVPQMMSQVLSTNLLKNAPRLIDTEQMLPFLDNKTQNLKVGENMVAHRSEYITDKDINDVNIKRNFRKEIVTSNKSSTFVDGQENDSSDLPTSTDLLNQEEMLLSRKSLQRKYPPNIHEPELDEISTRNRNAKAYALENQLSDIINNSTGHGNIISKANAKDKNRLTQKGLLQNKNLNENENDISEKYLVINDNQGNENQKKLISSHLQRRNKKRIRKNNKKSQMNRRSSHLDHKNRHRKHKGRLRKSRMRHNTKIKNQSKLGMIRRRSKTTTTDKYNSNKQSAEQTSTENSNINLKIAPDLFLDWIVSTSNDLNKNPEYFRNNYNEAPLNLSLLANEKNMNFQIPKDFPHLNHEEERHADPYVTGIDNTNEIQTENKTKPLKNMEFERSSAGINKSSIDHLSEKLLKSFKGPELVALLYGNTSLDNFLDAFYKLSRNSTTLLPRVQRKNISKNNTTEKHRTNKPLIISHKNDSKKNDKLSQKKMEGHHQTASHEDNKKKSDKRKKLHELTQNLKRVVRKFVNRHTNDEQKKKLMYRAALKKLPSILKKHINVLT